MGTKAIKIITNGLSALPLWLHYANAHVIGWLTRCVARYRLKVVRENIDLAFPEKTPKERKKIVKDFYLHFGQLIVETIWFSNTTAKKMEKSRMVTLVNPEETKRLFSVAPGIICLSGHFGNWEILGGFEQFHLEGEGKESYALNRNNVGVVYKKVVKPEWDRFFRESRLSILGPDEYENYIESALILRHIVEHARNGMFYFMDTDQRPYKNAKAAMEVSFMGREALTMYAGAGVAHKYGLAVTYFSMCRNENGKGYCSELKTICDDASKMEVQDIMNEFYKLLEADIRKDPGNYLWSHRRWKSIKINKA